MPLTADKHMHAAAYTGAGKLGRSKLGLVGLGKLGFGKVGRQFCAGGKLGPNPE